MVGKGGDFEPFPPVRAEDWRARLEREAKTKLEKLSTKLEDGRLLSPLHTEDERPAVGGLALFGPRIPAVWSKIRGRDRKAANRGLLADLAGGVSGLRLPAEGPEAELIESPSDFARLLEGVKLEAITFAFEPGPRTLELSKLFREHEEASGAPAKELSVHFGFDPIGTTARFGGPKEKLEARFDAAAAAVLELGAAFPRARVLELDTSPHHAAGASPDFELACLAGSLAATLRALESRGVSPDTAASHLSLTVPLDADFLMGLIKLRAARIVVQKILEACGVPDTDRRPPLFACTSRRMLTYFDPFVNILRGASASFAALTGGADAIEVAPYDERSDGPSEAARRLARNTTHVLMEEAQLARVADPGAGSYLIEAETRAMAESAWASFLALENEGGFTQALYRGQVALVAGANRFELLRSIQTRTRTLTGLSEFVDVDTALTSPKADAPQKRPAPALEAFHLAEPFEDLRAAAEQYRAQHGHLPEVQLLGLGPDAEHEARRTWMKNLLATGGVLTSAEPRPVVVVSGSDERYDTEAAPLAQKLKASGAVRHLILAGKPKHETVYRLAGYDGFIFRGEDVVGFLAELHRALGVHP